MTPPELLDCLRKAGFSVRAVWPDRLYVDPGARVSAELVPQIKAARAGLIALLLEEQARQAALDAIDPPDFDEASVLLESCTLLRSNVEGEAPEYVAVDSEYWEFLRRWAAERREVKARKAREAQKQKGRGEGAGRQASFGGGSQHQEGM